MGRRWCGVVAGAVFASSALAATGAVSGPAAAGAVRGSDDVGTPLPLSGVNAIVADPVHAREFVDGRTPDGGWAVVVVDVSGAVTQTIEGLPGAAGMALSPDSSTLYVAMGGGHGIAAVDTSSLAVRRFDTGSGSCPREVAVRAGLVWHSDFCEDEAAGNLAALDPVTGIDHPGLLVENGGSRALAAPPQVAGQLVESNDLSMRRLAVTGGSHPSVRPLLGRAVAGPVVVSADGRRVFTRLGVLDGSSLLPVDLYPWQTEDDRSQLDAVAVAPGGAVAVGTSDAVGAGEVIVYPRGQSVGGRRHAFGPAPGEQFGPGLVTGGLAFGPAAVYAVSTTGAPDFDVRLHVLHDDRTPDSWVGHRRLPLTEPSQIVADPRHGRVFVRDDIFGNGVVVTDSRGRIVKVLQHLPEPRQMTLSADRNTLYVATSGAASVAAVDTRTLHVRRLPVGPGACPEGVAPAAGLVWFTSTCGTSYYLGAFDPRTGQVHRGLLDAISGPLFPVPGPHGLLLVPSYDGRSRIAVTGGRHPSARRARGGTLFNLFESVAVAPDGMNVVSVPPDEVTLLTQATRNLAPTAALFTASRSEAVAIRGDGLMAIGAEASRELFLARQAASLVAARRRVPANYWVGDGFSFGHRRLYTLNDNLHFGWSVGGYRMPPVRRLALTQERGLYVSGAHARLVAHVDGSGRAARRTVSVYERPYGARRGHLVAHGRTGRFGDLRFTSPVSVRSTFTAVAAGSGRSHRLVGSLTVTPTVRLVEDVHDLAGVTQSNDIMPEGARPAFDVSVSPHHAGQCLFVELDGYAGSNRWRPVFKGCVRIGRHGRVRYVLPDRSRIGALARVRAVWKGDARNAAGVGAWRTIRFG